MVVVAFGTDHRGFSEWRRERIFAYLDPWSEEHALGKGYQLSHSLIAIGRGEIFGVGLGGSVEKLHWLPEAHTDFLMAVIGEEFGLVGVLLVIGLFLWLTRRIMHIGRQAIALDRVFSGLVAQGVGIWIGFQTFINMGVNLGALPTKGLTLPLMSYGGSAILMNLVALAVVLRIDYENRVLMRGGRAMSARALRAGHGRRHRRAHLPGPGRGRGIARRGWRVHWLGAAARPSMESQLVPPRGFAFETIDFSGVRGKGAHAGAAADAAAQAFWQSIARDAARPARRGGRAGRLHHFSGRHDERAAGQAAGAA